MIDRNFVQLETFSYVFFFAQNERFSEWELCYGSVDYSSWKLTSKMFKQSLEFLKFESRRFIDVSSSITVPRSSPNVYGMQSHSKKGLPILVIVSSWYIKGLSERKLSSIGRFRWSWKELPDWSSWQDNLKSDDSCAVFIGATYLVGDIWRHRYNNFTVK